MAARPFPIALLCFALSACAAPVFAAGCKIGKIAELPVTMNGLRPMVTAKINGAEAKFIADSGAFFSLIAPASAAEFKLRTRPAPFHLVLQGVGGSAQASITTVKEFTLAGAAIRNVAISSARALMAEYIVFMEPNIAPSAMNPPIT